MQSAFPLPHLSVRALKLPTSLKNNFSLTILSLFLNLGENWLGVGLDEFARCSSNLAMNRQTRMLSDLALIGCYNRSAMPSHDHDSIMLASAKRNLAAMSYFGLTEFQKV